MILHLIICALFSEEKCMFLTFLMAISDFVLFCFVAYELWLVIWLEKLFSFLFVQMFIFFLFLRGRLIMLWLEVYWVEKQVIRKLVDIILKRINLRWHRSTQSMTEFGLQVDRNISWTFWIWTIRRHA